jgi:hypothetical protein
VFQKSYIGNILGIGRNKFLKSYFARKLPEIRRGKGEGPQASLTLGLLECLLTLKLEVAISFIHLILFDIGMFAHIKILSTSLICFTCQDE